MNEDFGDYVEHPRYGRKPRTTSLNPKNEYPVRISWRSTKHTRIPYTAIKADVSKQRDSCSSITHYFDERRVCEGCKRPFIFFAQEQKHWYEEIGFSTNSDCLHCHACRKKQRGIRRLKIRAEELFHIPNKSIRENLEMGDCYIKLIQAGVFHERQLDTVRQLLKLCTPHGQSMPRFKQIEAALQTSQNEIADEAPGVAQSAES